MKITHVYLYLGLALGLVNGVGLALFVPYAFGVVAMVLRHCGGM